MKRNDDWWCLFYATLLAVCFVGTLIGCGNKGLLDILINL